MYLNKDGTRDLTQEETNLLTAAFQDWAVRYKPIALAESEHNMNLIAKAAAYRIIGGAPLNAEKIRDIVNSFIQREECSGIKGRLEFVSAVPASTTTVADEAPWRDEPMLRNLTSMSAVAALTGKQLKMFCDTRAMHQYDSRGNKAVSLNQKFNDRVAWLKANPDVVLDLSEAPKQQPQIVARTRQEEPHITAIREQIEMSSKGYTNWAARKRERLNKMLDDLLRNPEQQVYRDRSRGGIEVIKGLDAVERIMNEKIRDYESPFK